MKHSDAAMILDLSGEITPEAAKRAYRVAAKTYHPDLNPAGAEMMKIVNAAFDVLKDYTGRIDPEEGHGPQQGYSGAVNEALNAVFDLSGLEIEICGAWVWLGGDTRTHKDALKAAGYRYAGKKKMWYFRPENWRSSSRGTYSIDDIRSTYGSNKPIRGRRRALARKDEEAA